MGADERNAPPVSRHDPLDQFQRFAELQPFMLIGAKQAGVGPPHQLFRIAQNVGEGVDAVVFRFSGRGLVEHREDRVRRLVRRAGSGTIDERQDRKSTRLNSRHYCATRMPSSARQQTQYNTMLSPETPTHSYTTNIHTS